MVHFVAGKQKLCIAALKLSMVQGDLLGKAICNFSLLHSSNHQCKLPIKQSLQGRQNPCWIKPDTPV